MFLHLSPKERIGYVCIGVVVLFAAGFVGAQQLKKSPPIVFEQTNRPHGGSSSPGLANADAGQASSGAVVVDVAGAVKKPGVQHLGPDSRVDDAIKAAGGSTASADLGQLNLAAKLVDGSQVFVPAKGDLSANPQPAGATITNKTRRSPRASNRQPVAEIAKSYSGGAVFAPYSPKIEIVADKSGGKETASLKTGGGSGGAASPRHGGKKPEPAKASISLNSASAEQLEQLPGVGPSTAQKIIDYRTEHGSFQAIEELRQVKGIGEAKLAKIRPYVKL